MARELCDSYATQYAIPPADREAYTLGVLHILNRRLGMADCPTV